MNSQSIDLEKNSHTSFESGQKPLICWRSVFGGFLVSLFVMIGLLGLGMALGGIGLDDDTTTQNAGIFTGVWFIASSMISIFIGSYYTARVSSFHLGRVGSAQGILIAVLFVSFFLYQAASMIGSAGRAIGMITGKTASLVGNGIQRVANNDQASNTIGYLVEDRLNDLNLKSEPTVVATGIANRLMNGNTEGAKNYLARQAGITPAEADARIAQLRVDINKIIDDAKALAATGLKSSGWSLFFLVVLSAAASILGGIFGSKANLNHPIVREPVLRTQNA